jgi:hypothetical protein
MGIPVLTFCHIQHGHNLLMTYLAVCRSEFGSEDVPPAKFAEKHAPSQLIPQISNFILELAYC